MKACCPICYEEFNNSENPAKFLPLCCHSVCLNCLKGMFETRSVIVCPFKCNSGPSSIFTEPQKLPNNFALSTYNQSQGDEHVCKECFYPYIENKRPASLIKACGHTFCSVCLAKRTTIFNKKYFLTCPICKKECFSSDKSTLLASNRDFSYLLEESSNLIIEKKCIEDEETMNPSNITQEMFDLTTGKFIKSSKQQSQNLQILTIEETKKILKKVQSDEDTFLQFFASIADLNDIKMINELKTQIDKIKENFNHAYGKFQKLLEKMDTLLSDVSKKLKAFVSDINLKQKFNIIEDVLNFQRMQEIAVKPLNFERCFQDNLYRNQIYFNYFEEIGSVFKNNKSACVVNITEEINNGLIGTLKESVDEIVKINADCNLITSQLNVEIDKSNRGLKEIWKFKQKLNYRYSMNPFYLKNDGKEQMKMSNFEEILD